MIWQSILITMYILFNGTIVFCMEPNDETKKAVLALLTSGNINQRLSRFQNQTSLLLLASDDSSHETVVQILQKKPLIQAKDNINATALHKAARNNAHNNLSALLAHCLTLPGFNFNNYLNAQTIFGKTALHEAIENDNVTCAHLLLQYGANINVRTYTKINTETHFIFRDQIYRQSEEIFNKRLELLCLLYVYGAYFHLEDAQGKNVISIAHYSRACIPVEKFKKNRLLDLFKSLQLDSMFKHLKKSQNHFPPTDFPDDVVWLISNYIFEQELPRKYFVRYP